MAAMLLIAHIMASPIAMRLIDIMVNPITMCIGRIVIHMLQYCGTELPTDPFIYRLTMIMMAAEAIATFVDPANQGIFRHPIVWPTTAILIGCSVAIKAYVFDAAADAPKLAVMSV